MFVFVDSLRENERFRNTLLFFSFGVGWKIYAFVPEKANYYGCIKFKMMVENYSSKWVCVVTKNKNKLPQVHIRLS